MHCEEFLMAGWIAGTNSLVVRRHGDSNTDLLVALILADLFLKTKFTHDRQAIKDRLGYAGRGETLA